MTIPDEQLTKTTYTANRKAARILVAEDDEMLAAFLEQVLATEGYRVETIACGASVLARVETGFDLLLLDLNLPGQDGLSILGELRQRFPQLPALVLTARSRLDGLLPAFEHGADDCMLKPFSYLELLARLRVLLRRREPAVGAFTRCADLVLHREHASVQRGERRLNLTQREYSLLECLMRSPDVPVSRAVLLHEVWGETAETSTNVVDVYMKYIRDKVDLPGLPKLVRTVRGTGYMVSAA